MIEIKFEGFEAGGRPKLNHYRWMLLRTAYLLGLEGAEAKIQWAEGLLQYRFKNVWNIRSKAIRNYD
jgi:hypothetical protein